PSFLIELSHLGESARDFVEEIRRVSPRSRIVVTSLYSSIGSAMSLLRLGVSDYLPKPVTVPQVLRALDAPEPLRGSEEWLSLDRACGDYIEDVLQACGSISQTARALGLDRRSLRRMLERRRRATELRCECLTSIDCQPCQPRAD